MAIISVIRQTIFSYSMDIGFELQATEYFLVTSDTPIGPTVAETADGVPVYTQPHPDDPRRLLKQKRPQCVENSNRMHWQVQCDYSNLINPQPNPLLRPPVVNWDYDNGSETYFIDRASEYQGITDGYGNPVSGNQAVTNTAGEPFEKLSERDAGTWSATWTKNVAQTFTVAPEINTMQRVNSDTFPFDGNTIAQYAAKISGGSLSAVQTENGYPFRTLTYKLKFKDGGWLDNLANVGFQEMSSGKRVDIVSGAPGTPPTKITKPWPLDDDGVAYPDPTTTPDLLQFYPYHTTAFSGLLK
jgi:hypothetical protein